MKRSIRWETISLVLVALATIYLFINAITLCFVNGNITTGIGLVVGFMAYLIYLLTIFLGEDTNGKEEN